MIDFVQKSSKFLLENMTLVLSSANSIAFGKVRIIGQRSFIYVTKSNGLRIVAP
jgi:hypothetical protein